jgi:hypothetical protein
MYLCRLAFEQQQEGFVVHHCFNFNRITYEIT